MNIRTFASKLTDSGVKPSLFEVNGSIGGSQDPSTPFLIKAASLPGQSIGVIEVPYRGRRIKIPGDRAFADWSITIINDGRFNLRTKFERWMNNIQGMENLRSVFPAQQSALQPTMYQDWSVKQLDRRGNVIKTYALVGCFPTDISAIDLSYEATDQIEEFTVTLAYSYFGASGINDGIIKDTKLSSEGSNDTPPDDTLAQAPGVIV